MMDAPVDAGPVELDFGDIEKSGLLIWNYYKVEGAQNKGGGVKNLTCIFCDSSFSG